MPNWCNNNITISGPTETIKQLWEDAQTAGPDGGFGLLEAMAPIGEWDYGTAVETWGTKWDISDEGLEFTDNGDGTASIQGWFDSAWAPPIGAYEKFCDDMDNCEISASYFEPGMDFAGFWHGMEEHLDDLHEVWENDPDNELFRRLDEEYNLSEQFAEWDEEFSEE
jgi:hypothetical protein